MLNETNTTMTIQEILTEAGHPTEGDNRNRAIKGCNQSLKAGIKITICERGRHYTDKNDKHFNLQVSGFGWKRTHFYRGTREEKMTPFQVLRVLAWFLQGDNVRKELKNLHAHTPRTCGKCNGKGIIPAFYYYAEGICFDCMGLGTQGKFEIEKATS